MRSNKLVNTDAQGASGRCATFCPWSRVTRTLDGMNTVRYMEAEGAWLCSSAEDDDIEILVEGTQAQVNRARLALIEAVLLKYEQVTATAKSFLDEFVDRTRFADGGDWFIEGICSVSPDTEDEFTIQLTIAGDTYGFWTVKFRSELGRYWPISLTRRTH
jgi:hypothetical protein